MIPRYNRPIIENIWTLENKFKLADPILHKDLFDMAEKEVKKIEINNEKLGEYYKLLKLYDRASIINDII